MNPSMDILRRLRKRRRLRFEQDRPRRLAGRMLLAGALAALSVMAAALALPMESPKAELVFGDRPTPTYLYDRTGKHLLEALASGKAADVGWYSPSEDGSPADCAVAALYAGRGWRINEDDDRSLAAAALAVFHSLSGFPDPAADAARELWTMERIPENAWNNARLAALLAMRYSERELAEWLLNVRLYGRLAVGVDDAALVYFGVHAEDLTIDQCAALEAFAEDSALRKKPQDLTAARNTILNRMADDGWIGLEVWRTATRATAGLVTPPDESIAFLDAYLQLVKSRLSGQYEGDEPARAGLRVITALDMDFFQQALCASQNYLLRAAAGSETGIVRTLSGEACATEALLGPDTGGEPALDISFVAIEPDSGELLAYFDSARGTESVAEGEMGSALLPFLYLGAFTRGLTPATMLMDIPLADGRTMGQDSFAGPVSARIALQDRKTAAAERVLMQVGEDSLARILNAMGLQKTAPEGAGILAWMRQPISLPAFVHGYSVLAADGVQTTEGANVFPVVILRVEQANGRVVSTFSGRQTRRLLGEDLAFILRDILSDPSWLGTIPAPALSSTESEFAAVFGEGYDTPEAWAFLLSPGLAVGAHAVFPSSADSDPAVPWAISQAAGGWAMRGMKTRIWEEPGGITRREVCVPSGLLPTEWCPSTIREVFLTGTEPTRRDTFYRPVAVNNETGFRATLWTPLQQAERRIFFFLPPEAEEWARETGFSLPPESYDTLPETFPYADALHLALPAPLSVLRGEMDIRGTVAVEGMTGYRLQAGWGLYPSEWYLIAEGTRPVRGEQLARWQGAVRDGIWSILLTALLPEGRLASVAIPVTVDNTPPVLRWIIPAQTRRLTLTGAEVLLLQVEASDAIGLVYVEFLLDGQAIERFEQGPFSIRWEDLEAGTHQVGARAVDLAGNECSTPMIEVDVLP